MNLADFKKKKILILSVSLMLLTLSACGKNDSDITVPIQSIELDNNEMPSELQGETVIGENQDDEVSENYKPKNESFESDTQKAETDVQKEVDMGSTSDDYAGVYKDCDVDEPNLEIQINDDGTYAIQIGIFRLAYLDDGVGKITDKGLEFSATAPNGNLARGIITLDNEVATVTFTAGWSDFSDINEFKYYKISDEISSTSESIEEGKILPEPVVEVSDKEMTVPYMGENFRKSVFAVGGKMVYVCGIKTNGYSFLGYMQKEENIFHEFDVEMDDDMRVFNMVVDKQNRCHVLWMSVEECVLYGESFDRITYDKSYITIVNSEGKLEKIDVSGVFSSEQRRPFCFAVNEENNYYFENENKLVEVLSDGTQGKTTACDGWIEGIGVGKSGTIYCTYEKEDGTRELAKLQEGSIISCSVELPKSNAMYAGIYAGTDSELLLFNKESGTFAYNDDEVEVRVPGTELPVQGSMIDGYGILSDGRVCIMTQKDVDTTFYYIPAGK